MTIEELLEKIKELEAQIKVLSDTLEIHAIALNGLLEKD